MSDTTQNATPIIQRLDADPRDPDRVVVTIGPEDGSALGARTLLVHIAVVAQEGLRTGLPCPPEAIARLEAANTFQQHYARALNFLAVRPRSAAEVRQRLRQKGTPPEVIDGIVARLGRVGYLDDAAFARFWIAERARSRPSGARLLRAELRMKGVATDVIEQALAEADEAEPEPAISGPTSSSPANGSVETHDPDDLAEESREVREALGLAQRKLRSYSSLEAPVVRRRLSAFLLRRGYPYATVSRVLKRVLAEGGAASGDLESESETE